MKNLEKYLLRLREGDPSALNEIYALTSKALFSLCLSILKDKQSAEDALHDAYMTVMRSKSYREGGNAFSWLYTICKNSALKALQRRGRFCDYDLDRLATSDQREISEDRLLLMQLLNKLGEEDREIVLLHCYADMKHKDIARVLNIPEGTVRYRYAEAIKKLKEEAK